MSEDEKKKDVFIQEQIRKKPFYRRKCFQRTVRGTVAIVLLGVSAGGTFAFVQPLALQYRKEKDKMVVVSSETCLLYTSCWSPMWIRPRMQPLQKA